MCRDCNLYANYLQQHGIDMPNADVKAIFHGVEKVNKHASTQAQPQSGGNYSVKPLYAGPMRSSRPTGYTGSNVIAMSSFTSEYANAAKEANMSYLFSAPSNGYDSKPSKSRYAA